MKKQMILLLFFLVACRPVTPSVTHVVATVLPVQATVTALLPVSTDTATPQPTTLPERALSQNGPWVFVPLNKSFFAINPDGTGYTPLKHDLPALPDIQILNVAVQGKTIAYVEGTPYADAEYTLLKLRTFPSNEEVSIPLGKSLEISAFTSFLNENGLKSNYDQYVDNVRAIGELAWSPNGKYLAFTGAVDGPTSDVYVYSLANGAVKRLSDATTQAVYLHWTPDSRYIVYAAATSLNTNRSGGGFDLSALWAVTPDGAETKKLLNLSWDINILGWMDASKLVFDHFHTGMDPYSGNLEIVDVNTAQVTTWLDGDFQVNGYDLKDKVFLFSRNSALIGHSDLQHQDGTYLLTQTQPPKKISDMKLDRFGLGWNPNISRFLVQDMDGHAYAISASGKMERMPFLDSIEVIVSPDGKYWSGGDYHDYNHPIFKIGDWNGQIWLPDASLAESYIVQIWSPDSRYCYLLSRENFFVMSAPDFKILKKIPIAPGEFNWHSPVWIAP